MKVLWITNILFEHHLDMMGLDKSKAIASGSWLYAAYKESLDNPEIQLHIATIGETCRIVHSIQDGNHFYILPAGKKNIYDIDSIDNIQYWKTLRNTVSPDCVIVWGSETRHAYLAAKVMHGVPMAIYVQGLIRTICNHYYDGWPTNRYCCTLRDYIDKLSKHSMLKGFYKQKPLEEEMFKLVDAVIIENEWAEAVVKSINPFLRTYWNKLPIRKEFFEKRWDISSVERHTIFTNAGGYPIKGHHILFKALDIVKRSYPDVKCYVPGVKLSMFNDRRRRTGYMKYLNELLRYSNLRDNVIYTGNLSSGQMVEHILRSNVYVMPSVVENHSSSLIEAKIVGVPCISSMAGGVSSFINNGKNGLLYNTLDADSLAGHIINVFQNDDLALSLSSDTVNFRNSRQENFGQVLNGIYSKLVKLKK